MNTNRTMFTQDDFHAKVQRGKDAKTSITHPKHGRHGLNAE